MGRFHRHDDGTVHSHDHGDHTHHHDHGDYVADPEVIGDHSGYDTEKERIEILEDIYAENDHLAEHNRQAFAEHNVKVVNLMSSPGSGKTTLLERTLAELQGKMRIGIIEGDIETPLDADKPLKYPVMFRSVEIVVVNKMDLAPYLNFDMDRFRGYLKQVNPGVKVVEVSAEKGQGIDAWVQWLQQL